MIKIVPNRVTCDWCKVQLEYEQSDIVTIDHTEELTIRTINSFDTIPFTTKRKTITCPNCKYVISL